MIIEKLDCLLGSGAQADIYRAGNKAVKLYKEHCPKSDAFKEAAIHAMVENAGVPVPKLYEVIEYENKMAIVMELIEGITMRDQMLRDMANIESYLDRIVDLQITIHNRTGLGLPRMEDRLRRDITKTSLLSTEQKTNLLKALGCIESGNSLCHGDYHFLNLVVAGDKITVIDWVDATCGSPEADLCRSYLLYYIHAPAGFADRYLEVYCRKTGKSRAAVLRWLPIIAGARLSERNEAEQEQLLRWVESGE